MHHCGIHNDLFFMNPATPLNQNLNQSLQNLNQILMSFRRFKNENFNLLFEKDNSKK